MQVAVIRQHTAINDFEFLLIVFPFCIGYRYSIESYSSYLFCLTKVTVDAKHCQNIANRLFLGYVGKTQTFYKGLGLI